MIRSLESKTTSLEDNAASIHVPGPYQETILLLDHDVSANHVQAIEESKDRENLKALGTSSDLQTCGLVPQLGFYRVELITHTSQGDMRSDTQDRLIREEKMLVKRAMLQLLPPHSGNARKNQRRRGVELPELAECDLIYSAKQGSCSPLRAI